MEEFEIYKKRAADFYENAKTLYEKEKFDLAMFNLEQSLQLWLKYFIGIKLGDFPQIHSLIHLLKEFGKVYEKVSEVEEFIKNEIAEIELLNNAYINARYLPFLYTKEHLDAGMKAYEKIIKFLQKIQNEQKNIS